MSLSFHSPPAPPPLILALESSGTTCSVALARGGDVLAEISFHEPYLHDNALAESSRILLQSLSLGVEDVQYVCVSAGPGSFTGLRIGAAFAKALCFDNDDGGQEPIPKLIAVPTLQAIALEASTEAASAGKSSLLVATLSHKNLAYVQRFYLGAEPLDDVALTEMETVLDGIRHEEFICGSGFSGTFVNAPVRFERLSAAWMARLGAQMAERGDVVNADEFVPFYVQDFVTRTAAAGESSRS